jgi:AAA15 family ATPase/GTPase
MSGLITSKNTAKIIIFVGPDGYGKSSYGILL